MPRRFPHLALAVALCLPAVSRAALIVNQPRPITHRVTVQLVQTATDEGSPAATVFGNAAQRAEIESYVNVILSQAGIDVQFLPTIVPYNSTFAYQGTENPRPAGDLNRIISQATTAGGILHPDSHVIDMFLVKVVPGWGPRNESWVGGIANLGRDGIALAVGQNALSDTSGMERIAHWVAHEIAHNLGLKHVPAGTPNLLNESRVSQQLDDQQIAAIFQSQYRDDSVAYIPAGGTGFPQLLPPLIAGDYNRDGVVDSADFTLWRNAVSTGFYHPMVDGNGDGVIDHGDYTTWKANYGLVAGGVGGIASASQSNVPEPATWISLLVAAALSALFRHAARR